MFQSNFKNGFIVLTRCSGLTIFVRHSKFPASFLIEDFITTQNTVAIRFIWSSAMRYVRLFVAYRRLKSVLTCL